MIITLIYVNEDLKVCELSHSHTYEMPDAWARLIIEGEAGAEVIKVK